MFPYRRTCSSSEPLKYCNCGECRQCCQRKQELVRAPLMMVEYVLMITVQYLWQNKLLHPWLLLQLLKVLAIEVSVCLKPQLLIPHDCVPQHLYLRKQQHLCLLCTSGNLGGFSVRQQLPCVVVFVAVQV